MSQKLTMNNKIKRSPLFYVGDKYKLMSQLVNLFPKKVNNFYEPFVGGGTVFLNVNANKYFLNDIDKNLINIHEFLIKNSNNKSNFFKRVEKIIYKYNLSRSYKEDIISAQDRQEVGCPEPACVVVAVAAAVEVVAAEVCEPTHAEMKIIETSANSNFFIN